MTDADEFEHRIDEPGAIGVGMGGSCPVCRAPVDLGQEFCLECGSPIRFTPRQRKQQKGRSTEATRTTTSSAGAPPKTGFPWVPALIVIALIGGGGAFALVDGGDSGGKKSASTEPALPKITNSVPEETTSDTETVTVEDCSSAALADTQPAIGDTGTGAAPAIDPITGTPDTGEEIPQLEDGSTPDAGSGPGFDDGSIPSTDGGSETVTVDGSGNLCAGDAASDPNAIPTTDPSTDPNATDPAATTPAATTPASSGDWPAGKEGWTVVVFGYNTRDRAVQAAADVKEDGFSDGGVLLSTDFKSLCPGFHIVFSGVFDEQSEAVERRDALSAKDYAGMYVREISTTKSPPGPCDSARPQT